MSSLKLSIHRRPEYAQPPPRYLRRPEYDTSYQQRSQPRRSPKPVSDDEDPIVVIENVPRHCMDYFHIFSDVD